MRNTKYYQEYNKAVELTANLAHKFFTYISSGEAVASLADDGLKKEMSEIRTDMIKDATTEKDITELFWFLLNLPVLSKLITEKTEEPISWLEHANLPYISRNRGYLHWRAQ